MGSKQATMNSSCKETTTGKRSLNLKDTRKEIKVKKTEFNNNELPLDESKITTLDSTTAIVQAVNSPTDLNKQIFKDSFQLSNVEIASEKIAPNLQMDVVHTLKVIRRMVDDNAILVPVLSSQKGLNKEAFLQLLAVYEELYCEKLKLFQEIGLKTQHQLNDSPQLRDLFQKRFPEWCKVLHNDLDEIRNQIQQIKIKWQMNYVTSSPVQSEACNFATNNVQKDDEKWPGKSLPVLDDLLSPNLNQSDSGDSEECNQMKDSQTEMQVEEGKNCEQKWPGKSLPVFDDLLSPNLNQSDTGDSEECNQMIDFQTEMQVEEGKNCKQSCEDDVVVDSIISQLGNELSNGSKQVPDIDPHLLEPDTTLTVMENRIGFFSSLGLKKEAALPSKLHNQGNIDQIPPQMFSNTFDQMPRYSEPLITCQFCDAIFNSKEELSIHLSKAHSPQLCFLCDFTAKNLETLENHVDEMHHAYKVCKICCKIELFVNLHIHEASHTQQLLPELEVYACMISSLWRCGWMLHCVVFR